MTQKDLLGGKRILIVDDEPDVLETLEEFLTMCDVTKATTFEKAKNLLETRDFELAILDIMGVKGYELGELTRSIFDLSVRSCQNSIYVISKLSVHLRRRRKKF